MQFIVLDFESYYDKAFSLSKLTTEEYIRDDLFEVIGVGVKINDEPAVWFSGTHAEIKTFLDQYDWADSVAVAHNAMFDAAILSWIFNIKPSMWVDTLSLARAIDGLEVSGSLKAAAQRYGLGAKGEEVIAALGKGRIDFTAADLAQYGEYCKNDCDLTWELWKVYAEQVSFSELEVIDLTIRMFSEPVLELDLPKLEQHLVSVRERKEELMRLCAADSEVLQSNAKFAELLESLGVEPPMKVSARTKKQTYAFAKTDEEFKALADHPDEQVQALVAARLGTKSTLEETRTQRFIEIAKRGSLPVPLNYYGARTGRWSGVSYNLQNLPSRGNTDLKDCILAPEGHVIIDCDSSQIEARMLAWVAGQEDLVEAFAKKEDVYKIMASKIYRVPMEEVTKEQRAVGKATVLGSGYGMSGKRFRVQLQTTGIYLDEEECNDIIATYRKTYPKIPALWRQGQDVLEALINKRKTTFGVQPQAVSVVENGFLCPNGYVLRYPALFKDAEGDFSYKARKERVKIFSSKVVENVIQMLARCVIAEQMVWISQKYRPVLTVHDAIAIVAKEDEAEKATQFVERCMRKTPHWAEGLPLNCESGVGRSYGEC